MKKFVLVVFACALSFVSQATIRTVNNVSGLDADYTTMNDALAASIDGDTIYVQPSPNNYGGITLNKRLVIMGAGHNPLFSLYDSYITQISFGSGSGSSVLKGLSIQVITSATGVTCNNVLISGCKLNSPNNSPLQFNDGVMNGWIFEGCTIQSGSNFPIELNNLDANLIIRNCYAMSTGAYNVFNSVPNGTHIDHCILLTTGASVYSGVSIGQNVLHTNNIISTSSVNNNFGVDYSCSSCTFNNNLLWNAAAAFPTPALGTGNIVNVDPLFANFGYSTTYSYNWDFHVADNSQANNAATDGSDIGIYGGIFNFNHNGIDGGSPHIVDFSLESSSAPQGGTITIHLNANGSGQ